MHGQQQQQKKNYQQMEMHQVQSLNSPLYNLTEPFINHSMNLCKVNICIFINTAIKQTILTQKQINETAKL